MDPFATDVLVEILWRLPPNSRRRCRLVCRRWRNLVDNRTLTNHLSRAKNLLVGWEGSALILGDKIGEGPRMVLAVAEGRTLSITGTCNGLICLCDSRKAPGAIAIANPATGERLLLPPLPCAGIIALRFHPAWYAAFNFAYHQMTGRYMVVHLPCCFDRVYEFDTLQVFTLVEGAWRDVPTPKFGGAGASCRFDTGVVSIDGTIHWEAEGTDNIVSFDLGDECVTLVKPLPMEAMQLEARDDRIRRRLADLRGRLSMAILYGSWNGELKVDKTDVWVLESAMGQHTWALRYTLEFKVVMLQWWQTHELMLPHFTHGELVLCVNDGELVAYLPSMLLEGVLQICEGDRVKGEFLEKYYVYRAFPHVETKEPLSIYKLW